MNKGYVPRNDRKFLIWTKNVVGYAMSNAARWKVVAPDSILTGMIGDFEAKLDRMDDPNHGKVDTLEKDDARKVLEKAIRVYVQGYIAKNPLVTNADKESMELPIYDKIPTIIGSPQGQATADVEYIGGQALQLHIKHVSGTPFDEKANYGYKIYYGVFVEGGVKPGSGEDLPKNKFTRRKKETVEFAPTDVGKIAYFAIRYENSKGKAGVWGPMFSAVIP